jgi:hypothetical protein
VSQQTLPTTQKRAGAASSLRHGHRRPRDRTVTPLLSTNACVDTETRTSSSHRPLNLLLLRARTATDSPPNAFMQPSSFDRGYHIPCSWSTGIANLNRRVRDTATHLDLPNIYISSHTSLKPSHSSFYKPSLPMCPRK